MISSRYMRQWDESVSIPFQTPYNKKRRIQDSINFGTVSTICVSRTITLKEITQVDVLITLNCPSVVGHDDFLEPMLILTMKPDVGHINCIPRRLMWVIILFCVTFVL